MRHKPHGATGGILLILVCSGVLFVHSFVKALIKMTPHIVRGVADFVVFTTKAAEMLCKACGVIVVWVVKKVSKEKNHELRKVS